MTTNPNNGKPDTRPNVVRISDEALQTIRDLRRIAGSKAALSFNTKIIVFFSVAIVIASLFFLYRTVNEAYERVVVVTSDGRSLPSHIASRQDLLESLMKQHCAQTVYLINSFDRLSIHENQTRARFLVDGAELAPIFAMYKSDRAYADALDRGVIYKAELQTLDALVQSETEYDVTFTSLLTITEGDVMKKIIIRSHGLCMRCTAQYPENPAGFFFRTYHQDYEEVAQ